MKQDTGGVKTRINKISLQTVNINNNVNVEMIKTNTQNITKPNTKQ